MNELHLFAGAGGGILGGMLLGHTCVCAVEWDKHARQVLLARQRDGCLPRFPIWDDVQTFDGKPWRGRVDVICGGFPCQDISAAGKGAGIDGKRSGMWTHMARIVGEIRPKYALMENSPMLTSRGLGRVLGDLAAMGYDAQWDCFSAGEIGAPHERQRIWILASDPDMPQCERGRIPSGIQAEDTNAWGQAWRASTSPIHRVDDGVARGLDRLKRIGNGQVPSVAALAFKVLSARLG